jgi:hypothetical protein
MLTIYYQRKYQMVKIRFQNAPGAPGDTGVWFGGLQNLATIFTTQHNDVQLTLNELSVSTWDQLETLTATLHQLQRNVTTNFICINRQPHRMMQALVANVAPVNVVQLQEQPQPPT